MRYLLDTNIFVFLVLENVKRTQKSNYPNPSIAFRPASQSDAGLFLLNLSSM